MLLLLPRRTRVVLLSLLAAAGLLLLTPTAASAHDEFLSSTPEAGSTVGTTPTEISLTFSGDLLTTPGAAVLEVLTEDGTNLAADAPLIDATTLTQPLTPDPISGVVTVRWKVVSSDGHPISGEFTYTVAAATITPTPTPTVTSTPTPSASPTTTAPVSDEPAGSDGDLFLPILLGAGTVLVVAVLLITALIVRQRLTRRRAAEGSDES